VCFSSRCMTLVRDRTSKLTRASEEILNSAEQFPQNSSRKTAALDLKMTNYYIHITCNKSKNCK
jgi:hypothetical protein